MSQKEEKQDKYYILISGYCRIESRDMNIIDGIIMIIFEYHKFAKWSNVYKGSGIKLFDDDTKAECIEEDIHSVRADFAIKKGEIISWELNCFLSFPAYNFLGVVSSAVTDFTINPSDGMKGAYGLDDNQNSIYNGNGTVETSLWKKPMFAKDQIFTIKVIADWRDKQCKLTFYYNGTKLNEDVDDYTMLLPELDDDVVLYPCFTPYDQGSYCIIRYI